MYSNTSNSKIILNSKTKTNQMKIILVMIFLAIGLNPFCQDRNLLWNISPDKSITWNVKKAQIHSDQIEMSGLNISAIISYGVDENGELINSKKLVFPMLRTIPNNTHASLSQNFDGNEQPKISVNGTLVKEFPETFNLKGILSVKSTTTIGVTIERTIFPSRDKTALIEILNFRNITEKSCEVLVDFVPTEIKTPEEKGVYGEYILSVEAKKSGTYTLEPFEEIAVGMIYSGRKSCDQPYNYSPDYELSKRKKFIAEIFENLVLDTPNDTIDQEFAFAKIRATESIYDTKGGLMHGPGGGAYYAAIWANDQAEYVNPFFPFLGNPEGNESAINSFRHFARYMNPEFKPIPSSIIAEGTDYWNGAGDRGDQAMIAYGASHFSLAYGSREIAKEFWPLIRWCIQYLETKKSDKGVIGSDSDELEGRFPAGRFNLSTNSLAYGAYISASHLANELGKTDTAKIYYQQAADLRNAIENYFGANVQGFDTYRYFDGNDKLRSWICLPLTMGIFDRKEETTKALFSPYLWTENGILTEAGSKTFWDRSTLYAFRGLFNSGATEQLMPYLSYYSAKRLLGDHVPYPVEAWPEGNQRHLSAESGLYCRVITEGLFGINPVGLNKFEILPRLPENWDFMQLKNIKAFDKTFDINIKRNGNKTELQVISDDDTIFRKELQADTPVIVEL